MLHSHCAVSALPQGLGASALQGLGILFTLCCECTTPGLGALFTLVGVHCSWDWVLCSHCAVSALLQCWVFCSHSGDNAPGTECSVHTGMSILLLGLGALFTL